MEGLTIMVMVMGVIMTREGFVLGDGIMAVHSNRRARNVLIFPPSSVLQLTMGVTTKFDFVGDPSGQISYGFQQNVALPTNYTELLFPPTVKMKRSLNVEDHLQHFFGRSTMNGTECIKKVICQVAESPLHGGLLEEILTFVFTPSNHEELFSQGSERHPFFVSESIGRQFGDCHAAFPDCQRSPLDLISRLDSDYF